MRIIVGYDGSKGADAAVEDLKLAGLPDKVHALVISVADVLLPPSSPGYTPPPLPPSISESFKRSQGENQKLIDAAGQMAEQCAHTLRGAFPSWTVEAKALADSPAWGLLKMSSEWGARLIVVGAHDMATPARLFLGSVSQRVVTDATCSVRVVHRAPKASSSVRLLVGVDGSEHADRAIAEVAARKWPSGSSALVLTVIDNNLISAIANVGSPLHKWIGESDSVDHQWVKKLAEDAAERLRPSGLSVTTATMEGNTKSTIVEEAESWGADCIFVGARGLRGIKHALMGSVSAAIASHAQCTVEVVRVPSR